MIAEHLIVHFRVPILILWKLFSLLLQAFLRLLLDLDITEQWTLLDRRGVICDGSSCGVVRELTDILVVVGVLQQSKVLLGCRLLKRLMVIIIHVSSCPIAVATGHHWERLGQRKGV